MPSKRESISMVACVEEDSVRLARSHCVRRRRIARWLPAMSLPRFLRLGQKSRRKLQLSYENPCKYSAKTLEVLNAEIHHSIVEVLTAQVGVASGGLRLVEPRLRLLVDGLPTDIRMTSLDTEPSEVEPSPRKCHPRWSGARRQTYRHPCPLSRLRKRQHEQLREQ